jgi:uncharacterized membrane protein
MAARLVATEGGAMRQLNQNDVRHPVNRRFREDAPLGARVADRLTEFIGSWTFVAIQTAIVAAWIAGNIYLLVDFDPYPFILLNLAFSTQAAYAAPLILLASNRHALRDRMTLEHAADETDIEEQQNRQLLEGNRQVLDRIERLERRLIESEKAILGRFDGPRPWRG